jgi:predicted ATPase
VSTFIGREADLLKVADEVRRRQLVTLTGVGGVGKTRLAVEVARRLSHEFPDGIWLLELAAVSDPDVVPDAVAAVFGVTQRPGTSMAESIAEAMEGKTQLLVVDNCEHLRDAAAEVIDTILARSATVHILATSREGLGLADEHLWAVPSLDVHAGLGSAAVDLFVDRARAVVADFELGDPEEEVAAVEICRRLDGIPLAIELAASRMASMSVSEVRDRLGQRFRLLVGSRRGLERHQTLRHTVAWSFDLLDATEKALHRRCSVFAGGFDLAGACAVAGPGPADEFEVLDALDALVRKSLIVADRSSGRTRYSMLETIRQFAEDQLVESGIAGDVRTAHAAYFAAREAELEAWWNGPRQREAYDWFMTELHNLRSAFRWAADESQLDLAATIATYAAFLGLAVENLEAVAWAEELIPSASAANHPRLALLQMLASQCWMPGRAEESVRYSDDALRTLSIHPVPEMPFGTDGLLGAGYMVCGQPARAVDYYRMRIESGTDAKALNGVGLSLALMAVGDRDGALSAVEGLIDNPEVTRNPYALSFAQLAYSSALIETDPGRALEVARRGVEVAQKSGNRSIATYLMTIMSRVMVSHGDPHAALDQLSTVIRHYLDGGNLSNLRSGLAILSTVLDHFDRHAAAATIAGFAVTPFILATVPETTITIANLRARLGPDEFERLRIHGEAMTVPAIAEFAEAQLADLRAEITSP